METLSPPESCTVQTPISLARAMVHALGHLPSDRWLDPCVGTGVFVQALSTMGVDANRITALDLDQNVFATDDLAKTIRGVDFISWGRKTKLRFTKIVANPPYVALTKLAEPLRRSALAVTAPNRQPVGLGSNYWYAFACASLKLLSPGGDICFVLPAAWDYADYAAPLRNSIPNLFASFERHRTRRPMFGPVQDGCVVIIGRGFRIPGTEVNRFEYDSAKSLITALENRRHEGITDINPPTTGQCRTPMSKQAVSRLQDVLTIRLGGVTGDVHFFLLTERERRERQLPIKSVRPVLSKARHLISGELTEREWRMLREKNERVWLFDPQPYLTGHPHVKAYIDLPVSLGGCQRSRYKIVNRNLWYRTPLPRSADGFMSGMTQSGPWICLRGMSRLTATNTLYTVKFREFLSLDEKAAWALSLLTSYTQSLAKASGRVYPSGLLKYEPSDLLNLAIFVPRRVRGAHSWYLRVVKRLLSGDIEESQDMANVWFR